MSHCPCRTAKRLVSAVLAMVDHIEADGDKNTDEYKKIEKDLVIASAMYKQNRHLYENSDKTKQASKKRDFRDELKFHS